ncbi:hypothetical protein EGT67_11090 [Prescottella agglutinans]|uniref:Uncharacterized protein n=1 Tax=Prescottella agglutinans TaxID=1644129 RepID=A0A3S3EB03_9NOCA|nr:hypothetical protein EGT67_11090 [Prescottella agglutinans]
MIAHDDYHAAYVGTTIDGNQFFVTTPFASASDDGPGAEFAARYLFDASGALVNSTTIPLGTRPGDGALPGNVVHFDEQENAVEHLLSEIQPVSFGDITVAPFSVMAHGHEFGLILHGPDSEDDPEWYWNVTVEPGDYMAFYAPWDDGEYDT